MTAESQPAGSPAVGSAPSHDEPPRGAPDEPVDIDPEIGLTSAEVDERVAQGRTNDVPNPTSRTYWQIIQANVFTRFNAILGTLLVAILAVGQYRDALFGIVLVLNSLIGIVQETRSKWTLDRLTLLNAPKVRVRRDGETVEIPNGEVVADEIIELSPGDQVTVDGVVCEEVGLEIDESLLTGESDPVHKEPGDEVQSGSFVAVGSGVIRATAVGEESYAFRLGADARRFTLVHSELRDGVNAILRIVQWMMIPTAVLLIASQIRSEDNNFVSIVQGSVAGLGAIIPEGLVLLTSTALIVGVLRLGRKKVLTQELAAIEGLARIDVICLDKTGTITEGELSLATIVPLAASMGPSDNHGGADLAAVVLGSMATADPSPNPTLAAIATGVRKGSGGVPPTSTTWSATEVVPFSSARKWSAATFDGHGSFVLGAPDILLDAVPGDTSGVTADVNRRGAAGQRVILLARSTDGLRDDTLPDELEPVALCVLEETIRPEAREIIEWFGAQEVTVKVISGDSPVTVGAVAARAGVPGAENAIDARTLPEDLDELAEVLETHSVFGRVTPQQKRAMVHALQSRGHEVAMTGDGVNDTLALKDAEIGVAMGSGSPAARAVARFVLLDNNFAVFPSVVAEGRKVLANVERVANLFLTKSFYALCLAIATGIATWPYPFVPRHFTIISALTIGIPGFFLALSPNQTRFRPGFLGRVLRFAIPAGVVAAAATFAGYALARFEGADITMARTSAVIVLFIVAFWVLSLLAKPYNHFRVGLVASMAAIFIVALGLPQSREFFALQIPPLGLLAELIVLGMAAGLLLDAGLRLVAWKRPDLVAHGT
ncbi:MAG: HAD-IC family P-type ATPase [Acidimicrobiia bacterium]|nr:HAD-IC family P-type ATPase [Acidimicrobiia bacterium]